MELTFHGQAADRTRKLQEVAKNDTEKYLEKPLPLTFRLPASYKALASRLSSKFSLCLGGFVFEHSSAETMSTCLPGPM